jgi:hypothetical protein
LIDIGFLEGNLPSLGEATKSDVSKQHGGRGDLNTFLREMALSRAKLTGKHDARNKPTSDGGVNTGCGGDFELSPMT